MKTYGFSPVVVQIVEGKEFFFPKSDLLVEFYNFGNNTLNYQKL